ncbi:MAG: hypothetical protein EA396_01960 [Anaerolineaceae bacterium]|nr:MAG: hypothetical protein EA396_01960 [Anaerolineaceae bacterium]
MDITQRRLHALERHIQRLERGIERYQARSEAITRQRVTVFIGGVVAFVAAGATLGQTAAWLSALVALMIFGGLVIQHNRIKRMQSLFAAMRRLKRDYRARVTLDWSGLPPSIADASRTHPFAWDIDITGDYSLHRLLDTCTTRGGADRLLGWLLASTPEPDAIARRQELVRHLIPLRGFRERLALKSVGRDGRHAEATAQKWDGQPLQTWLEAHTAAPTVPALTVIVLAALAVVNIALFILSSRGVIPPLWLASFVLYGALSVRVWSRFGGLFSQAMALQSALSRVQSAFAHLETYPHNGAMRTLCQPLIADRPSAHLRRIAWIVSATSIQRNPVIWIMLNLFMPYDVFFAYWLGRARGDLAAHLPRWLDVWYQVEALGALATFAYLHPAYTFPHISDAPTLTAQGIGHPLIPPDEKICNDFTLDGLGQVVVITGSNMSGKSSFLRTLGLNMALAYAGSVTDTAEFHLGLFRLFTCIRVTDSVVDGISYFYAEVKRLKALLDALHAPHDYPLFFLIDEIFRGTNNRERLIGSEAFIRALVGAASMGLISTHDLELVRLADDIPQIHNYHFREHIEADRMAFDYILRDGPSPTTNALKIMMIEGLPVGDSSS